MCLCYCYKNVFDKYLGNCRVKWEGFYRANIRPTQTQTIVISQSELKSGDIYKFKCLHVAPIDGKTMQVLTTKSEHITLNIQGYPFLATQGLESCSKIIFIFVRTFPAAIAGRGDYFHYDIETKEAVRQQILFHILNIRFMKTSFYNPILTLIFQ